MQQQQWRSRRRTARLMCGIVLLFALVVGAVPPAFAGVPRLLTFDDLPVGTSIVNQFDGLTFVGATNSNPGGSLPLTVVQPAQPTASGTHALQSQFMLVSEFSGTQLTMAFAEPQSAVSLATGLAPNQSSPGATMLLQGYATDPNTTGAAPLVQSVAPCMGTSDTPITTNLTIVDGAARIHFALLALVSCQRPTDPTSGGDGRTILLDNLEYARPLNPPPRETDPPLVTIISPANGTTVTGSPGSSLVTVQAAVIETAIYSMTVQVNTHPPVPMAPRQTGPQQFAATVTVGDNNGVVAGANTIVVRVWDFDQPQKHGSASATFTFQPTPFPPPSPVDIIPTAFEVNQVIDNGPQLLGDAYLSQYGFDVHVFDHPLLQGKPTMIRVYAAATGTTSPQLNVPAVMDVDRANCNADCRVVSGESPLLAPGVPNLNGINVPPFGVPDSAPSNAASNLSKTWDFLLAPDWTTQDLVVTVQVNDGNYDGLPHRAPVRECTSGIAGQCFHNNEVKLRLHFARPPVEITIDPISIHVTGTYQGVSYNDVAPTDTEVNAIFQQLTELYPAKIRRGVPQTITVDPGISKDDLLDRIRDFYHYTPCFAEPLRYNFYLGIFPGQKGNFAANERQPNGSIVGYGSVGVPFCGAPGAWADSDNPLYTAHELGHDVGMPHWGCENGVQGNGCEKFPIAHAGIGGVGVDIDLGGIPAVRPPRWRLILPGDNSANNTPHAHDFMSYGQLCGRYGGGAGCDLGEWVSWYTYDILLNHPTVGSYNAADPPGLLVSGRIAPTGIATLRPLYQIDATNILSDTIDESRPNQIYTIRGYDQFGNTLFVHNFQPQLLDVHTADFGKALIFDQVVPVVPNLQRLAVFKGTQLLGERTNPSPGQPPSVSITSPMNGSVWPIGQPQTIQWQSTSPSGVPLTALVQYSPDGGATHLTLGRDLSGSLLTVDPDELPGSTNAYIYIQVSDGINIATTQVGPFTVTSKPPGVSILAPQTNNQVTVHIPLSLQGEAFDRQETLNEAQFRWTSDRDGFLGSGSQLTTRTLSVGSHVLTLTVTDREGLVGQAQIHVQVQPIPWIFIPLVQSP